MSITITRESREVLMEIQASPEAFKRGGRRGLMFGGRILKKTSQDGIKNPPKTGRVYKYKGRRLRAGAPGQFPRNRSGRLRRSISFNVSHWHEMDFGDRAGEGKNENTYGHYLEPDPDRTPKKVQPRPWGIVSVQKNAFKVEDKLTQEISKELNI